MSAMYKVGDKVVIVSTRTDDMNSRGLMDKYLGTTMTIEKVTTNEGFPYRMKEDNGEWFWNGSMINHEATQKFYGTEPTPVESTSAEPETPYNISYYTDKVYNLFESLEGDGTLFDKDCRYTRNGIRQNVNAWYNNKAPLFKLLRKHPLWNEEAKAVVYLNTEHRIPSADDAKKAFEDLYDTCAYENDNDPHKRIIHMFTELTLDKYNEFIEESNLREWTYIPSNYFDEEGIFKGVFKALFSQNPMNTINADVANCINTLFPDIKATVGQKTSRVANKLFCKFGFDKTPSYNRLFAKLADSMNPFDVERISVLSCNIIDFLLMSNGNSWSSCHTIINNSGSNYGGCYKGGTLSHANDSETLIFYTLDKDYKGTDYCLEPKINRQVFFWDYPVLVQERLYPQCNDVSEQGRELVKQYRSLVESIFATALETPNLWVKENRNRARISARSDCFMYEDWDNFPNYIVHLKKEIKISESESEDIADTSEQPIDCEYVIRNAKHIMVGGDSYCIYCGEKKCKGDYYDSYNSHETLLCASCCDDDNNDECYECGHHYDRDDMHLIDGEYYCEDCCFWCDYHDEYETGRSTYIEGYGDVCDDSLDNFGYCDDCDCYHNGTTYYVYDSYSGGRYVCESCLSDYTLCDNCGEFYETTEEIEDCQYCERCAEEYRAEHSDDDEEEVA